MSETNELNLFRQEGLLTIAPINFIIKFIYFEKPTIFCEISTVDLSYVLTAKSTVEISQNFVAFSEYMNFTKQNSILFPSTI